MRAPAFWWRSKPTFLSSLLRPIAWIYGSIAAHRMARRGAKAALPVICIGNFTAGGAGKTPTALLVAECLSASGEKPAFLSRGYGGKLAGPVAVASTHDARDVGDEPLLLVRAALAIVSRDRPAGARLASAIGATAIVMDDGLQNASLVKDLAIAVVDGATGIGNGLPLPAGPLRAPLDAQWPHVDAVVVIGDGAPGEAVIAEARRREKPSFRAALVPEPRAAAQVSGRHVLAFAGIGRPEKFFDTLRACGAIIVATRAFPDHQPYDAQTLRELASEAEQRGLTLVTTEKDLVRIGREPNNRPNSEILSLPVSLQVADSKAFRDLVLARIGKAERMRTD